MAYQLGWRGRSNNDAMLSTSVFYDAYDRLILYQPLPLDTVTLAPDFGRLALTPVNAGMTPEQIERVFEPFFTTKGQVKGSGLGLPVVHGIVSSHRGAIRIHSKPGAGTVFDLYFRAAERQAEDATLKNAAIATPAGRGEHVLYVDDEEQLVDLVTRMMERMGYNVTGMTRPTEAIDVVRAHPKLFDLVLSDLSMPGMSGLDLAEALLQIPSSSPPATFAPRTRDARSKSVCGTL